MLQTAVDPFAHVDAAVIPPALPFLFEAARDRPALPPPGEDQRGSVRFNMAAEAVAVPLALDGSPVGKPFRGVVADLSTGGLRILHGRRLTAPLLAVRLGLGADAIEVVVRVTRSVWVRSHYEYAGPFVAPVAGLRPGDLA